jgi:hypothetical protein
MLYILFIYNCSTSASGDTALVKGYHVFHPPQSNIPDRLSRNIRNTKGVDVERVMVLQIFRIRHAFAFVGGSSSRREEGDNPIG